MNPKNFVYSLIAFSLLFTGSFWESAWAQLSTTATISGTVTDSSGAVLPGATVTVEDEGTHIKTVVRSNQDGSFIAPGLPVDSYSVGISKQGFQSYSVTGILLHPATTSTINGTLSPGSVSTGITVTAAAALVETSTSEVANEVDSAEIESIPLNGRNYQGLATVMPGVQNTSEGNALGTGGRSTGNALSVNGLATDKSFYALDGVWNENTGNMGQTTVIPNPDSLQEVRVLQNNYSAKYSLMGSSVVLLQTKSGTSQFHGTAWEFLRNDIFNSKPYFATKILPYKQNIFGYNLGGPLYIPHLYNTRKQKTFFFFSEQFVILHQATGQTGITPTQDQRNGVFNSPIKDPTTGLLFPRNTAGQYVIPANRINPNSTAFTSALYPLPNFAGVNNYVNTKPQITDQRDDEIKIDHHFSSKLSFLGEYLDESQTFTQSSLAGSQGGEVFPTNWETDLTKNKLAQVALTAIMTPQIVNTTSIGMNIFDLDLNLSGISFVNQVPGFTTSLPYNGYLSNRLPLVTFSGGIGAQGIAAARPLTHAADLDDTVGDDLSWLRGKHYIQAGLTVVFNTKRQNPGSATNGQFSFSGNFTAPPAGTKGVTQDDAFADFLLGDATTFTQASNELRVAVHGMEISPYVEDRIKLTHNFTLTAGIRVYYMPLPHPPPHSATIFVPAAYSAAEAPIVNANGTITLTPSYNPLNGLVTNGTDGLPENYSNKHTWYFGPIAGFAWDVLGDGKTAVRGGYGFTYTRIFTNQDCSFSCATNPPALQSSNLQNANFPAPQGTGTAKAPTIASLSNADLNVQATQIQSYSLSVEHEFPRNWTGTVTAASSQTRHLVTTLNLNQASHDGQFDFNPIINSGTTTPYLFSPYQGYGAISTIATGQNQNWNALEASLRHPVGSSLDLTIAYTYAKDLSDVNVIDVANPHRYYGNVAGLNFPHTASFTAVYNVPWLLQSHGMERFLLGGWKVSGISTLRSGVSLSPGLSVARQGNAARPDVVAGQSLKGPKSQKQWFNTAAFKAPAAGYYGNAGTGIIQGPGLVALDTALYKEFHIRETNFFEFRAEAFNLMNHTNFTNLQTAYGTSNYGSATAATDPRILELALRYKF